MQTAIFLSWEMEENEYDDINMQQTYFKEFISEYMKVRPLNINELKAINDIYKIIRPFRYRRLKEFHNLLDDKQYERANRFLEETLKIMNTNVFNDILSVK